MLSKVYGSAVFGVEATTIAVEIYLIMISNLIFLSFSLNS